MRATALLAFFLTAFIPLLRAQSGAGFEAEVNLLGGRMVRHTKKLTGPLPRAVAGVEAAFVQQTAGQKPWHAARGYPLVGAAVQYLDYGIDSVYGRALGAYPFLQIPIVRGERLEWTFRPGFGIGYISRHYDRQDYPVPDTFNPAIGSHLNNFSHFSSDLRWRPTAYLDVQVGAHFTHVSNASFRRPNLGLNVWGVHAGVRYFPAGSRPAFKEGVLRPRNRWAAQTRVGLAFQEDGPADGPIQPVYLASVWGSRRWRGWNKVLAGVEAAYYTRIEAFLKNNEIHPNREAEASWRSGVFVGNEFLFGRFGVLLQAGVYIKQAYLRVDPYYQRVGVNYYLVQSEVGFLKEGFVTMQLLTHRTQAELAEVGVGVGF